MANENKFDSGHVVVPVLHSSGTIHTVAVPHDTDMNDLHNALLSSGYEHPVLNSVISSSQPTEEGTVEESPEFQKANREIFDSMNHGAKKGENAAFLGLDKSVKLAGEQFDDSSSGGKQMHINIPSETAAITHVHPDIGLPQLSPADIKVMQSHHLPVYAVSKHGLYTVDADGKPYQVFSGTDWMTKNFQQDARNNKAIDSGNYVVKVQLKGGREIVMDSGGKNYPIDLLKKVKAKGGDGFSSNDVKSATAFGPGELKPKK